MPKEIPAPKRSIITLLNNANDLISISNKRKEARQVIMALKAYARDNNIDIPEEKIDRVLDSLLDCRSNTLSYMLTDIAKSVIKES